MCAFRDFDGRADLYFDALPPDLANLRPLGPELDDPKLSHHERASGAHEQKPRDETHEESAHGRHGGLNITEDEPA